MERSVGKEITTFITLLLNNRTIASATLEECKAQQDELIMSAANHYANSLICAAVSPTDTDLHSLLVDQLYLAIGCMHCCKRWVRSELL